MKKSVGFANPVQMPAGKKVGLLLVRKACRVRADVLFSFATRAPLEQAPRHFLKRVASPSSTSLNRRLSLQSYLRSAVLTKGRKHQRRDRTAVSYLTLASALLGPRLGPPSNTTATRKRVAPSWPVVRRRSAPQHRRLRSLRTSSLSETRHPYPRTFLRERMRARSQTQAPTPSPQRSRMAAQCRWATSCTRCRP